MLLIAAILGSFFIYALIVKPEYVAVVFFTITIADMNVSVEGLPVNLRALMGLALFARTLVPMKTEHHDAFFYTPAKHIVIFLLFTMALSEFYDLLTFEYVRTCALTFISAYTGYHFFYRYNDTRLLKISLYIAGVICFSDLVYTYIREGEFPVLRIYKTLLGIPEQLNSSGQIVEVINHGFYGLICGMSFVVLLTEYINGKLASKIALIVLPVMFLGVLMSTSRSALLGVAGISFFIIAREFNNQARWQRAASLIMIIFSALIVSVIVFMSIQSLLNLNTDFIDAIALRLIDEPIAVLNKHLGLNYNVHALGAMEWRTEASSDAFGAFLDLNTVEQFFGIGFWGYVTRNLGHNNLPPHNGLLMLLIEFGIAGLVYWSVMIYSFLVKSFKVNDMTSPMSIAIIFIILFSLANNAELTGSIMFLFVSTLIAENIFYSGTRAKVISMVNQAETVN